MRAALVLGIGLLLALGCGESNGSSDGGAPAGPGSQDSQGSQGSQGDAGMTPGMTAGGSGTSGGDSTDDAGSVDAGGSSADAGTDAGAGSDPAPTLGLACGARCDALGFECRDDFCNASPGTVLWQRRLDGRFGDRLQGLVADSKGNSVIAFVMTDVMPQQTTTALLIRKMNERGETMWEHQVPADANGSFDDLAIDARDRLYAVGRLGGTPVVENFLRVVDADGTLIDHVTYTRDDLFSVDQVAIDPQGNIWLTGSTGEAQAKPFVIRKLDPNRKELWTRTYHVGNGVFRHLRIDATSTGNVLVGGTRDTEPREAWVALLDPEGNELWSDSFHGGDASGVQTVLVGADDELWAAGYTYMFPSWMRRYAADGSPLSMPALPTDREGLQTFALAPDGRVLVGGSVRPAGSNTVPWLLEIGSDNQPGAQWFDGTSGQPYDRALTHLAVAADGDLLVGGSINFLPNTGIWLARIAGPDGGVPDEAFEDAEASLLERPYPDHDGSEVFTDPKVPQCEPGGTSDYQLRGEIDGTAVTIDEGFVQSQFNASSFYRLELYGDSMIRNNPTLAWEGRIVEGQSARLTGGKLWIPPGHPQADQPLCITEGDLGVLPATYEPNDGRTLRFRITGARLGEDCSGAPIDIDVRACFYRTDSYIP